MTKYLNLMTCTAVAVALASPAFADIVNLYEMNNMEFYGSEGFGKGKGDFEYSCNPDRYEYSSKPEGAICTERKFNGGTICYIDCKCNESYKYDENNCTNGFVLGGQSCYNPKENKTLYTECNVRMPYQRAIKHIFSNTLTVQKLVLQMKKLVHSFLIPVVNKDMLKLTLFLQMVQVRLL